MLRQSLTKKVPWSGIEEFAISDAYCGQTLYPRQLTLLKLIYLETENMTAYDLETINKWRVGFQRHRDVFGVQPDIWERIKYLKDRGYRRFPHIQAVLGRRASKGFIGAILAAEQIAYLIAMDDPQTFFNIRSGKDCFLNVGATSQTQAQRHQFADIRDVVEGCAWLQPYIAETKDHQMRLRTPADLRRIAVLKAQNVPVEHTIATLWVVALSASSVSGRGATSYGNFFDEFAFHVQGTDSTKSSENIYEDWQPSLGQFKKDALTYVPSSPFCLEPSTPVLTEDLRWVSVGSLKVGDKLIGFDEHVDPGKGQSRKWRQATVTEISVIEAPRYAMTLASGKRVVCTGEHLWLTKRWPAPGQGKNRGSGALPPKFRWVKTSDLQPEDEIKSIGVDPWEEDTSRDGGYLAGIFDGEGHYSGTGTQSILGIGQNVGSTLDKIRLLLKERGFDVASSLSEDDRRTAEHYKLRINGGFPEIMRFLGTIRPERLVPKLAPRLYGSRTYSNGGRAVEYVASVERVEDGPVVALGTSTSTLVAEGMFSHNTKTGKFYELYQTGKVLMSTYQDDSGIGEEARAELAAIRMRADKDEVELAADPGMLIFQGPSWALYEDWERGPELVQVNFEAAPEDDLRSEVQMRSKLRNPEKFMVEREGQFAEVLGQYLDRDKVEAMFNPVAWREPHALVPTAFGRFDTVYRIHVDPSKTGANFALAIAHTELSPVDQYGDRWPHVIMDRLHVWRAQDFPINEETGKHEIDYIQVERELDEILYTFPSTSKFSSDQWNSVGFLQRLRKKYAPNIQVTEETATERSNYERAERFKSAINLGWIHSFRDELAKGLGMGSDSLLEQECKFLSEKNGKIYKQEFGPVTTKDLYDAVSVVTTDLLHVALERWSGGRLTASAHGLTDVRQLRANDGITSIAGSGVGGNRYTEGHHGGGNKAWEVLKATQGDRARSRVQRGVGGYQGGRTRDITRREQRH